MSSSVSVKSDRSIDQAPDFSEKKKHHLPKGILLVSPTLVVYRLGRLAKTVFFLAVQ